MEHKFNFNLLIYVHDIVDFDICGHNYDNVYTVWWFLFWIKLMPIDYFEFLIVFYSTISVCYKTGLDYLCDGTNLNLLGLCCYNV